MLCCCACPVVSCTLPARISRCRLESCDPYCVFIKGNSDACITACQFVYGGKSAKSP